MIGAFALVGAPPFSVFFSEIMILISAFTLGRYLAAAAFLAFIAVAFAGIIFHISKIVYGNRPEGMKETREPVSTKAAFLFLLVLVIFMGLKLPYAVDRILTMAVGIIKGA